MCGRRSGKTTLGEIIAEKAGIAHVPVGWFAPTYKYLLDPWRNINAALRPIIERSSSQEMRIQLVGGGLIDFWTMDTPDPGRGRKYALVVVDECGLVKNLLDIWSSAIRPTLADYQGSAWFLGTPKGRREFFQLWNYGEQGEPDWASFRLETKDNPAIAAAEIEAARLEYERRGLTHIFDQEFRAIPADDGGNPFGIASIAACYDRAGQPGPVVAYGVDLAKSQDWTVVYGLDAQGIEVSVDRWQHVPWNQTAERVARIVGSCSAVIDSTGVGDPIVEQLQQVLPQVEGYQFTRQSKQKLMEGLAYAIQSTRLGLRDQTARGELETFGYEYTATGVRYSAPDGLHDDCVCALALAVHCLNCTPQYGITTAFDSYGVADEPKVTDTQIVNGVYRARNEPEPVVDIVRDEDHPAWTRMGGY